MNRGGPIIGIGIKLEQTRERPNLAANALHDATILPIALCTNPAIPALQI
jgi:hypothetical protein